MTVQARRRNSLWWAPILTVALLVGKACAPIEQAGPATVLTPPTPAAPPVKLPNRADSLKFAVNCSGPAQLHEVARVEPDEFHAIVCNIQDARRVRDEIERESGHRCALYASSLLLDDLQKDRMAPALAEILPYVDEHYWLPLYGELRKPLEVVLDALGRDPLGELADARELGPAAKHGEGRVAEIDAEIVQPSRDGGDQAGAIRAEDGNDGGDAHLGDLAIRQAVVGSHYV